MILLSCTSREPDSSIDPEKQTIANISIAMQKKLPIFPNPMSLF
jgi:hypothetical protein